jgi:hypothetical protein
MHLRFVVRVPADAAVDLSLVKLPEEALMFPRRSRAVRGTPRR